MSSRFRCALLWTLALAGQALAADPSDELSRIEALVAELIPVVEAQAGRTFTEVPPIVLSDPALLQEVLYQEQLHLLSHVAGMTGAEARDTALANSRDISTAFVGKYGFLDKKLYVMPDGIRFALAARGVPLSEADAITELVLAHELVHALQDQQVDLGKLVGERVDADGVIAVNCTVEGHAVWVQEQVGHARGHDSAVREVAEILGYDPDVRQVDLSGGSFYTGYVYGQGRNFIDYHAHRGPDAVWEVLAAPPASSAMIMDPASYATERTDPWSSRVRDAVDQARGRLAPAGWEEGSEAVGDYALRERLMPLSERGELLPDGWRQGWISRASASQVQWVEVQLLGFASKAAAREYLGSMTIQAEVDLALAMPPVTGAITGGPSVDGTVSTFAPMAGEQTAEQRFTFDFGSGERPHEFRRVWVARGDHVVQVAIVNHDVSDRRVAGAIRKIFRSVE